MQTSVILLPKAPDRLKWGKGGSVAQWLASLLLETAAPGLNPSGSKIVSEEKNVDVAEVNQWLCLERSELWFENVD